MRSDAWRDERKWVPESIEEAAELQLALIDSGVPPAQAGAVVGWLILRRHVPDQRDNGTRSRYRKVLRQLEQSGYTPPGRRTGLHAIPGYRKAAAQAA